MCGLVYRVCHIAGFTAVLFPIPDAVFRPLSICACVFACNKHFLQKKKNEDSYTSTIHDRFWSAGILQKGGFVALCNKTGRFIRGVFVHYCIPAFLVRITFQAATHPP